MSGLANLGIRQLVHTFQLQPMRLSSRDFMQRPILAPISKSTTVSVAVALLLCLPFHQRLHGGCLA